VCFERGNDLNIFWLMDCPKECGTPRAVIIVQAPLGLEAKVQNMRMEEVENIAIVIPNWC
jgi:hypothetical protein